MINKIESQINETSLSPEVIAKAREIIKEGLTIAEATPRKSAQEIWGEFQAIRGEIAAELMELNHQNLTEK